MAWTKEQEKAIYQKGDNILVAAAAGSGKTAVLVERIINKITNENIDVDKLCGITPFNVTPTFNNYNDVHMKSDGYRVSAECIAKYIK